jgi:hypothetical protein
MRPASYAQVRHKCVNSRDRQCTYNVILKRVRATTFSVEKHYVALGIQHAMHMRRSIFSSVACPPATIVYTISKTAPFSKIVTEHKICVLISLQHLSDTLLILRGIARKK